MATSKHPSEVPIVPPVASVPTQATPDIFDIHTKLTRAYLRERGELYYETLLRILVRNALVMADFTQDLAEHALSLMREGRFKEAAREKEFVLTFAGDASSRLEWLAKEADRVVVGELKFAETEHLLTAAKTLQKLFDELNLEQPPEVVRISPLAFLRSMWAIAWSAFRSPFTTTTIDLLTGCVIAEE